MKKESTSFFSKSKFYYFALKFDSSFFSNENDPFNIIKNATKEQKGEISKLISEIADYLCMDYVKTYKSWE